MNQQPFQTSITEKDGVLVGPLREPRNESREVKGTIHDDSTAKKLGMRGGTVAGSIHLDQFPPLLYKAFGEKWFQHGGMSIYFKNATTDMESVGAFLKLPEDNATGNNTNDVQTRVWMEREDGMLVCEGTASIGTPDEPSALQKRLEEKWG